ncbi:MAG: ThiF family adenylyltransferase [Hydrogenophaga sp.]|nr:ThiF family adenylyltransferase [Hydrogenophaga sp.]
MSTLGDSLRYLRSRGFNPAVARRPARAFSGALACLKGQVPVTLTISDWDFLEYPRITLNSTPSFLPPLLPHVDILGDLCYFAKGAVTLDRYDPVTALAQCLDQATSVLNKISTDPNYRNSDIQGEFSAHWELGQAKIPWLVYLGDIDTGAKNAHYFKLRDSKGAQTRILVCSDPAEAGRLALAWGWSVMPLHRKCWLLKTAFLPHVPDRLPGTVKELFVWLRKWDPDLSQALQNVLGSHGYLHQDYVTFAIDSPVGWIGFGFDLNAQYRIGYTKSPKRFRNYLHNAGGTQQLFRMSLRPIGSSFVHSRNLSYPDLLGKRITLIGCGAIGSFVATALVRLGAGIGERGRLRLIDPESLGPENLGRHTLGYPSLLQAKAIALREDLLRQFPHCHIEAKYQSVVAVSDLFSAELIVDATGEEAVGEYINSLRLLGRHGAPILHVWIRGNGEAVQALWADKGGDACYRCLLVPNAQVHRQERIKLLKTAPERRMDGCRAFTPYAVSAPMHAAALVADMICDWLQGDPSPRFRTRAREKAEVFEVKNQNLPKMKGCPACGQP